ncbi:MAG: glycosyltransferase family protein [Candidatus Hatepunaea meridiana]|nr:glycosyltransferase family protein [Candidatus Hatepunaea meridiana]
MPKRILICPLDWGIGHATRSLPIIRLLLKADFDVIIAADKRPYALLEREFPGQKMIRLPGYDITYPHDSNMVVKMIQQTPRLISRIIKEHRALSRIIERYKIDLVISDARFGLWTKQVPCVYMTHQVMVKFPGRFRCLESIFYRLHKCLINRYTECWIPDVEGEPNLSGDLSHKYPLPRNAHFIGQLSRFTKNVNYQEPQKKGFQEQQASPPADNITNYDLLILLSGPEPQRTIFEKTVIDQAMKLTSFKTLILQGKSECSQDVMLSENVRMLSHLPADELNAAILAIPLVLARLGHTTIMDLSVLGKKAILVPTPGQTEQEYLAEKYKEERFFYSETQDDFDLQRMLDRATEYTGVEMHEVDEEAILKRTQSVLILGE